VQAAWLDRAVARLLARAPTATRLLLIKDLRNFRRDPVQWSQVLIFFGLLVLYFFNMGGFSYNLQYAGWVNMVSFLNLSVVGLLMSTFTTRFIYPLASLEGRRFWLLGLLPLGRSALLWNKFLFAVAGSLVPCCGLILLSDAMLSVEGLVVLSHQLTCVVLCVGLAGIAVGLGARFANLREQSPARIAAGFGGTLNLVVSALYIVVVVLLTAVPCHFYLAGQRGPAAWLLGANADVRWWLQFWLAAGTLASLAVGALAAIVPMAIGLRAFRRIEF
jgi:ABC-2 type transport system permease protein